MRYREATKNIKSRLIDNGILASCAPALQLELVWYGGQYAEVFWGDKLADVINMTDINGYTLDFTELVVRDKLEHFIETRYTDLINGRWG